MIFVRPLTGKISELGLYRVSIGTDDSFIYRPLDTPAEKLARRVDELPRITYKAKNKTHRKQSGASVDHSNTEAVEGIFDDEDVSDNNPSDDW